MRLYESVYLSVYNSIFYPSSAVVWDIIYGAVLANSSDDVWDLIATSTYDLVYFPRLNFVHSRAAAVIGSYDT